MPQWKAPEDVTEPGLYVVRERSTPKHWSALVGGKEGELTVIRQRDRKHEEEPLSAYIVSPPPPVYMFYGPIPSSEDWS